MENKELPALPTSDDEGSGDEAGLSRPHSPLPRSPNAHSISFAHATTTTATTTTATTTTATATATDHFSSLFLHEFAKVDKPTAAAPYSPLGSGSPISTRQSQSQSQSPQWLFKQLRASFGNTERTLRQQVQDTPVSSLNDVRRAFRSSAQGISKRLAAWQRKHVRAGAVASVEGLGDVGKGMMEPEWWNVTCHTVPGGRVVVREGEWGSVIAFTLR